MRARMKRRCRWIRQICGDVVPELRYFAFGQGDLGLVATHVLYPPGCYALQWATKWGNKKPLGLRIDRVKHARCRGEGTRGTTLLAAAPFQGLTASQSR